MAVRSCVNLVLVYHKGVVAEEDFVRIAELVKAHDRRVRPHVIGDRHYRLTRLWLACRPTFVFATGPLGRFRPLRGRVFNGRAMGKVAECQAMENIGISVPRWAILTETHTPDLTDFGQYVVVKPNRGGRGADVHAYRKGRVRWKPRRIRRSADTDSDRIVQDFIYTGPWPTSYRVVTLFGKALVAYRVDADRGREPLPHRYGFAETKGVTVVSNSKGCTIRLHEDEEVIRLAEAAHGAFPDHALLGVDVIREEPSGRLYVIEVNTVGWTWHFSTPDARRVQRETGDNPYEQMAGLERAAHILAEKAVALAR